MMAGTEAVDLLKFQGGEFYFDEVIEPDAKQCIEKASFFYGQDDAKAERMLKKAGELDPENLAVMVGQYRFYYYQHRYQEALQVVARILSVVGSRLGFPESWRDLTIKYMGIGAMSSIQMVRFYLFALKGCAFLNLRLDQISPATEILEKICELDAADRIGARGLLTVTQLGGMDTVPEHNEVQLKVAEES